MATPKMIGVTTEKALIQVIKETKAPSIARLNNYFGQDFTIDYISAGLISLNNFINVGQKLNSEQIREIAVMIYEDYKLFTVADFQFVIRKAKKGHYGDVFRLDGMLILSWMNKHWTSRLNASEQQRLSERSNYKESIDYNRANTPFVEVLKKMK